MKVLSASSIILLAQIWCSVSAFAQASWTKRNPQPGLLAYSHIHFQNASKGILFTGLENNAVTINGGNYWSYQPNTFKAGQSTNETNPILDIHFATPLVGFASLEFDTLRKSTDGGETWNKIGNLTSIHELIFSGEQVGFASKQSEGIISPKYYYTTNGGTSWVETISQQFNISLSRRVPGEYWGVFGQPNVSAVGLTTKAYKTVDFGASWQTVELGNTKILRSTCFYNSNLGWISGDSGFVARTTDGGQTWQSSYSIFGGQPYYLSFKKMKFMSPTVGYGLANDTYLYKTTDGGITWFKAATGTTTSSILNFQFLDENTGWNVGFLGTIRFTSDGGSTWHNQVKGILNSFFAGTFKGNRAWLVGTSKEYAYWSADKGASWNASKFTSVVNNVPATDILFTTNQTGYIAKDRIFKTKNGGNSWAPSPIGFSGILDLDFPVVDTGYAVSNKGGFARTINEGQTWQTLIPPSDTAQEDYYHEISFPTPKIGYRTIYKPTSSSSLFKTSDAGNTWVDITSRLLVPQAKANIASLFFLNALRGWIVYVNNFNNQNTIRLASTADGGETWTTLSVSNPYYSLHFVSSTIGYGLYEKKMYRTLDGGVTWNQFGGVGEAQHFGIIFQGDNPIVLFGEAGSILTSNAWTGELTYVTTGNVVKKVNSNCIQEPNEIGLPNRILKVEPGSIFGSTNAEGKFDIRLETGNYTISQQAISPIQSQLESQFCPASNGSIPVVVNTLLDTIPGNNFINDVKTCPILVLSQNHSRMRPCRVSSLLVSIQNQGNIASDSEEVQIKFPPQLYYLFSSQALKYNASDSTYRFKLKPLQPNEVFSITILDSVTCLPNQLTGQQLCVKATIPNAPACLLQSPNWDGTDLEVASSCLATGQTRFQIRNKGAAMLSPRPYRIFIDSVLVRETNFQLGANGTMLVTLPANAPVGFARLVVAQSANHPLSTFTSAEANCSLGQSTNGMFPPPDESPLVDIECVTVTNAYDPNDKQVFPQGIGSTGKVEPETEFTYKIRFQNTGTDTAFKVVLVDTLDINLDIASLQIGNASHPFTFKVSGKGRPVLTWTFDNILLPDSNTNQEKSNGFVNFSIKPKTGLSLGTRLENFADIYFDFNDPIRTNTTVNTLWRPTLKDGVLDTVITKQEITELKSLISFYPNPTKEMLKVFVPEPAMLKLLALDGTEKLRTPLHPNENTINLKELPKGLYFIDITTQNEHVTQKIIIQ